MNALYYGFMCSVLSAMVSIVSTMNAASLKSDKINKVLPIAGVGSNIIALFVFWGNITYYRHSHIGQVLSGNFLKTE